MSFSRGILAAAYVPEKRQKRCRKEAEKRQKRCRKEAEKMQKKGRKDAEKRQKRGRKEAEKRQKRCRKEAEKRRLFLVLFRGSLVRKHFTVAVYQRPRKIQIMTKMRSKIS